ncbi:uncharacterized protein LOC134716647 [Mytilus trossulus]|uniref:uncharacterized protein LOC134716647 n=1 Tax=Mytilus trossulus TaxID=6551 RepID=UPI0030074C01
MSENTRKEITQKKSAAGENADEEKGLKKEHTVTFHIPKKEHGAGDDTPVHKKDFIFQNDGMEHDFNHNATRGESLNSFENEDDNELRALQMTEDKLEINETDNKKVSAEKINDYKVGIKELFKAAKKREKMEAKESEKKRKLKENESKKKGKMEAREIERKMEAQESKEKKAREEKKIKKKRKIDKKKAENQKKYEKCIAKGETQKRKEEFKSSQKKHQSEVSESKQKTPKLMDFVRSLVGCIRNRH